MIVIFQCAKSKQPHAGCLEQRNGKPVLFVSKPGVAPSDPLFIHAHPDDKADTGISWREELLRYNSRHDNPLNLLPAWKLYENETYAMLAESCGKDRLYILSAGWGLIKSEFLTPKYDITFTTEAADHIRRDKEDRYADFVMLPADTGEPIVIIVEDAYTRLACKLTEHVNAPRYLFYNCRKPEDAGGCFLVQYRAEPHKKWQYECAKAFMENKAGIYSSIYPND